MYLQITFDSATLSLWSLFFVLIRSFSLAIRGPAAASKLDWVKTPRHMSGLISMLSWCCTMCWKYHMLFICVLISCCLVVPDRICKWCPFDIYEMAANNLSALNLYLLGLGWPQGIGLFVHTLADDFNAQPDLWLQFAFFVQENYHIYSIWAVVWARQTVQSSYWVYWFSSFHLGFMFKCNAHATTKWTLFFKL